MLIRIALVFAVFPLLVADEIVDKRQFEALCKANGIESATLVVTKGKSVVRDFDDRHLLSGFSIPIRGSENLVKDKSTGEILFTYKDYFTHGGWLMRHTFLSLVNGNPLLFDGNGCSMKENLLSKYGFSQTN